MQIQMKLRVGGNNVVKRLIKTAIIKLLKDVFIEVNGFYINGDWAILEAELPSTESISELLSVICQKTGDYIREMYLIDNISIFQDDLSLRMVS